MPAALLEVNGAGPTTNGASAATTLNGYLDTGAASTTSFLSVGSTVVEGAPNLDGKDVVQQVGMPSDYCAVNNNLAQLEILQKLLEKERHVKQGAENMLDATPKV